MKLLTLPFSSALLALLALLPSCTPQAQPSKIVTPKIIAPPRSIALPSHRSSPNTVGSMPVAWADPAIFKSYNPHGKSSMAKTWTRKFDASGISFNQTQTCTLVTPQHVVMAAHYTRKLPSAVVFHDRNGNFILRSLVGKRHVMGDCAVGRLDHPVPANFTPYPLLRVDPAKRSQLKGEFVLVTDQNKRLFVHEISTVHGARIGFRFDAAKKIGFGKKLIAGDSGNPSFLMLRGQPVLIETHHTGGSGAGPFYGDPILQQKLAAAIRELGGTGRLRFISW